ncbi:MAG: hypothetical protein ABSF22_21890 [Bryobacteraceae bacterium]
MSCNKYLPHVLVLPEDHANAQLANGFLLDQALSTRSIQVLEEAGRWHEVINRFLSDHVSGMERYPERSMVLLIDFDGDPDRLSGVKAKIPGNLNERVYILGAFIESENLNADLGSYETIGLALAQDCREETDTTWSHPLLRHNAGELARLRERVRPILFAAP